MSKDDQIVSKTVVRLTDKWINLILHCAENMPFGDIEVKIVNGEPVKLLKQTPDVRLDKPMEFHKVRFDKQGA